MNTRDYCFATLLVGSLALTACRWETDLPSEAKSIVVDQGRELLVDDPSITAGALSSNAENGPLSFRHVMTSLATSGEATLAWLDDWSNALAEEGHDARARVFDERVTCAWLRRTSSNACDASCSTCAQRHLSLEVAPFRLVAVVNRTDLAVMPDRRADGGEGRLVFSLTDGPADDPTSPTLPLAVIFEYAQEGSRREWARRWHALGSASDFRADLTALTERFVASGSLAQVRSADACSGELIFHEFALDRGAIRTARVRNTPDWQITTPDAMRAFARDNATAIDDGTAVLPREWLASWSAPSVTPPPWFESVPKREALARATCAGCHAQSDTGFHVASPGGAGVSRFMSDRTKERDELRRRVEWMQLALSEN